MTTTDVYEKYAREHNDLKLQILETITNIQISYSKNTISKLLKIKKSIDKILEE